MCGPARRNVFRSVRLIKWEANHTILTPNQSPSKTALKESNTVIWLASLSNIGTFSTAFSFELD